MAKQVLAVDSDVEQRVWRQLLAVAKGEFVLSASDRARICRSMGWHAEELSKSLKVAANIAEGCRAAGCRASREALALHLQEAQSERDSKLPNIEAKIAKLQKEAAELEAKPRQLQSRLESATAAVEQLRRQAPPSIREEHRYLIDEVEDSLGAELRYLQCDLGVLESVLHRERHSQENLYLETIERHYPGFVKVTVADSQIRKRLLPSWDEKREELTREAEALRLRIADAQAAYDAAIAEANSVLDFWSNESEVPNE